MKSIRLVLEQQQADLDQSVHDVIQQKEVQLRNLRQVLQEARQLLSRILETDGEAAARTPDSPGSRAIPLAAERLVPPGRTTDRELLTAVTAPAASTAVKQPANSPEMDTETNVLP
jgi:hypothetical protein